MDKSLAGGASFPLESDYGSQSGMTLRDYFAAQTIAGAVLLDSFSPEEAAEVAYRVADAMIEERKKVGQPVRPQE
jgi:hypothetical protein